jgi:tripartite-type tricarboxylate transporter receptor subunit TctC
MMMRALAHVIAAPVLAIIFASTAQAQSPAEFYAGKTVDMYIGYSIGGGYDVYGRMLAKHLGKYIPGNPTVIPKNMDGAASLTLANWLYEIAPKDGTVLGTIGRGTVFDPLFGRKGAKFDGTKFTWIGSANDEVSVCVALASSGVSKFDDVLTKEMVIGGTGPSDDTVQFPKVINGVLHSKFNIITGYAGGNEVVMAMQRGEVQGRCGWSWSSVKATHYALVEQKKINILVQLSLAKHADLPNVPLATDWAKSDEQMQILKLIFARQVMGRPFLAPPGVPADRIEALRKAFLDTLKDKEFLADAEKAKLEINPVPGERIEKLVREIYTTPPEVALKAGTFLQ